MEKRVKKVAFIGLGLIGGSIAKAIRQYEPEATIVAFDKSKEALALATSEGIIDVAVSALDDNFKDCDYIFLCAPVRSNVAYLASLLPFANEDLVITDVGSVKGSIHEEVIKAGLSKYFIGGHPMAGSEKSGYDNSKAILIENAYYILSPTDEVSEEKIASYENFVAKIRAIPVVLDCKSHDKITAAISHLPHVIAACLVDYVKQHDNKDEMMKRLAAGGFKDITRIASSSPTMWQNICLANEKEICEAIEAYIILLSNAKDKIKSHSAVDLYELFDKSRNYRNSIPSSSAGPIKKTFAVYCDIVDEAGGIAAIATILASNAINIKNIGIIHNREFEEGVLRIEFYEEEAVKKASELLRKYRYIVYERD